MSSSDAVEIVQPRMLTLWCADWPVRAVPSADGVPIIVMERHRVVAACPLARQAGVRVADRRRTALRACPSALIAERDHTAEMRAFDAVVSAVIAVVPRLELLNPGSLCFDLRGPTTYFGGEEAVVERISTDVAVAIGDGSPIGIGIAEGRTASAIAAHRSGAAGEPIITPPGETVAALAPLSLKWLQVVDEIPAEVVDLFLRLGVRTIGDLALLDERDVLTRFGLVGQRAHQIATGVDHRPVSSISPTQFPEVERWFDDPVVTMTPVVFSSRELAEQLVQGLAAEGLICTRLTVTAETDHSERNERHWYRAEGLTATAIVDRVRWQLDAWSRDAVAVTAGVIVLRLTVTDVRADDGTQHGFWGGASEADGRAARAVTRLVTLRGVEEVRVPVAAGGRLPEDRYEWVAASFVDDGERDYVPAWPGAVVKPAPVAIPVVDVTVEVVDAHGAPVGVTGRGEITADPAVVVINGRAQRVVAWAGPWPLIDRWWDERRRRRLARLQIVLEDGSAHLLAIEHRRWHLMGSHA